MSGHYEPEYAGPPSRWIARGGRPAACLGDVTEIQNRTAGMPSAELDSPYAGAKFVVFELLIGMLNRRGGLLLFPRFYSDCCEAAPAGLVPLAAGENPQHIWRPWMYERGQAGWRGVGSQTELDWRHSFAAIIAARAGERAMTFAEMGEADRKAEEILRANLTPTQALDWSVLSNFRVWGGLTGNLYAVRKGNGFATIDPVTCTETASFCLHPEGWMPDADVALAHKLNLENPETEQDALESARRSKEWDRPKSTKDERLAYDMEKHYALV